MKCLIVEDDFSARKLLQAYLQDRADCFVAINGKEAVDAVHQALEQGEPYDLICLDIMMPEMDGQETLQAIRQIEHKYRTHGHKGAKVIMTTALSEPEHVIGSFKIGCESYIVKPIRKDDLLHEMAKLGLIKLEASKL